MSGVHIVERPGMASVCIVCMLLSLTAVDGQIHILHPSGMFPKNKGWIYGTTATFGNPLFNGRVTGELLYGPSKSNHCDENGDYTLPQRSQVDGYASSMDSAVPMVVVDRGDCTFVQKVRIAQDHYNAAAVVIIDKKDSTKTPEEIQEIVMSDDGNGYMVSIPCVLISRQEGNELMNKMGISQIGGAPTGERVFAELAWDIPRLGVVRVDYWLSAGSQRKLRFLAGFKDVVADKLKYQMQFAPHYHIFQMPKIDESLCYRHNFRRCAPSPDEGDGSVTGKDVVEEDLRQLCIWKITARKEQDDGASYSDEWWDYVARFSRDCPVPEENQHLAEKDRFGTTCSERVMKDLRIDVEQVRKCTRDDEEELLGREAERFSWSEVGLIINGWKYRGPMDPLQVGKAVCRGMAEPLPSACQEILFGSQQTFGNIVSNVVPVLVTALCVVALVFALWSIPKFSFTRMKREMRQQIATEVQQEMDDYAPLATPRGR